MKTLFALFAAACLCLPARAQTNQTILGGLGQIASSIGSDMPTNFGVYTFGVYAKEAHQWGGGIFGAWNFSQNIGVGMGIEAIGKSFWMPSAQLQLKLPMRPLAFTGIAFFTNMVFTPMLDAGASAPLGSASSGASTVASIAGGAAFLHLANVLGGELGIGGGYDYWGGAGKFSGDHYHGGLELHWGF